MKSLSGTQVSKSVAFSFFSVSFLNCTKKRRGRKKIGNTRVLKNVTFTCFPVTFLSIIEMQLLIVVIFLSCFIEKFTGEGKTLTEEKMSLKYGISWAPHARFHLPNMDSLKSSEEESRCPEVCLWASWILQHMKELKRLLRLFPDNSEIEQGSPSLPCSASVVNIGEDMKQQETGSQHLIFYSVKMHLGVLTQRSGVLCAFPSPLCYVAEVQLESERNHTCKHVLECCKIIDCCMSLKIIIC